MSGSLTLHKLKLINRPVKATGMHFFNRQRTTKLILGGNSVRAQKAFALDYCASAFVTEGIFLILFSISLFLWFVQSQARWSIALPSCSRTMWSSRRNGTTFEQKLMWCLDWARCRELGGSSKNNATWKAICWVQLCPTAAPHKFSNAWIIFCIVYSGGKTFSQFTLKSTRLLLICSNWTS